MLFVALSAAAVLQGLPAQGAPADDAADRISALIEQMGRSPMDGMRAHDKLVRIGKPAVPALIKAAGDRTALRRMWAISALCTIGDTRAARVALDHFADPDATTRHVAIYHSRRFVRRDEGVASALVALVGSKDPGRAQWAIEGLGRARYEPALKAIRGAAANPNGKVRWRMMDAVERIDGAGSIPFFVERLRKDSEPALRRKALACLGRAGVKDQRVLGAFVGALRDRSAEVRMAAGRGLQMLTDNALDLIPGEDVSRDEATAAVKWWLANRDRYPPVGKPKPTTPAPGNGAGPDGKRAPE